MREEVIGKNIKFLIPGIYALNHDKYLENAIRNKKLTVISKSRDVFGK